jgi:glycogenin glucosyltransferase
MSASCKVADEAFVTLATTDSYAIGALVLGHSLQAVGTSRQLVVLITNEVTQPFRTLLEELFDVVTVVDVLNSNDTVNLALLTRPDLGVTFTKLHCWRLTQYSKCVFLDADTLVVQNIDELFDREEFSAAPDAGWPDCFNSGVFVFRPSERTYSDLVQFSLTHGSFDGGDQGLLNLFFSDWSTADSSRRLPFTYNIVSTTFYSYLPAFKQFGKNTKVLHFIGSVKPWHTSYNVSTGHVQVQGDASNYTVLLKLWWNVFMEKVRPKLESTQGPQQSSKDTYTLTGYTHHQLGDVRRQQSWERGQIDYLGIDSFENILSQLKTKLA